MKRILVFGVFDGIHEGHRAFLQQARQSQNKRGILRGTNAKEKVLLVAAVTRDEVVERLKGRKPRKDQGLRIKELMEAGLVDEAVEGDEETGRWEVIGKVRPDIIALGYDQDALRVALQKHIREKGLQIEVVVMEAIL